MLIRYVLTIAAYLVFFIATVFKHSNRFHEKETRRGMFRQHGAELVLVSTSLTIGHGLSPDSRFGDLAAVDRAGVVLLAVLGGLALYMVLLVHALHTHKVNTDLAWSPDWCGLTGRLAQAINFLTAGGVVIAVFWAATRGK